MRKSIIISAVFLLLMLCSCSKSVTPSYPVQSETEHFEIYSSNTDKEYAQTLADELEQYCRKIETKFKIDEPQKIKLAVYDDETLFRADMDIDNEAQGTMYSDKGIVSLLSSSAGGSQYSAVFYYSSGLLPYAIIKNMFDAPEYLLYGASMIDGYMQSYPEKALEFVESGNFPDMKTLQKATADDINNDKNLYLSAIMLSEYIWSEYSDDSYIELLNKPNTKTTLNADDDELRNGCIEYIKKTYAKIPFDLQKETEHFKFYCEADDLSAIDDVVQNLENNYERVTSDLQINPLKKFDIVFFPNQDWFLKAINVLQGNITGLWKNEVIYLQSPAILTAVSHEIPNTALHEFIHALTYEINPEPGTVTINRKIPPYIVEGIAQYEAGGQAYAFMEANEAIRKNTFPTFDELEKMNSTFNPELYTWGSLFFEYVDNLYGSKKIAEILKNADIEEVFGKNKGEIRTEWIEYLKKAYKINM